MRYLAALLLLLSAPCHARDWTATDTTYEAAFLVLWTADWAQTRYIAANPDRFHETNNFLGEHPSDSEVNRYFIAGALLHTGVSYLLPPGWRRTFQVVSIGVEAGYVSRNYRLGVQLKF